MSKKTILKIVLVVIALICISSVFLGILFASGVIVYDNGFALNTALFDSLKGEWYIYLVFFLLQIVITTILGFIPATSMMFIGLGVVLFGTTWECFVLCASGVVVSSILMDFLGRFGGAKLITKMFSKEDYEKATKLVETKGIVYLPIMYLLPIFPDDAICAIAGLSKVKFWYHLLCIVICRGIGVATIVFGLNLIPFDTFTSFYDYLLLGSCLIVYLLTLLFIANKIDKYLTNKRKK